VTNGARAAGPVGAKTAAGRDLLIRIDAAAGTGLQQQIYAGIRRAILDGVLPPGTRLPSSRTLAADLGVSRTTTVLALDQLIAEGYVAGRRGSGTFVTRELPEDLPHFRSRIPRSRSGPAPTLSKRGTALTRITPPSRRVAVAPPRPFRLGTPALDLFPTAHWARLVGRRLRSRTAAGLDYGDVAGLPALREAIAGHVQAARGTRCGPDQVHVVAGAQRGLELICRLLLDPGDEAWVEEPGYPGAWSALASAGARPQPVLVDDEGLDPEAARRPARLIVVTPSHQFPLGVPMSLPRRLALLERARTDGAWIVEDDYDAEFRHGARAVPCLHGLDADGRVIYLGSFSKSLFPALRLGFLVVPAALTEALRLARVGGADHAPPALVSGHFERPLRRMRAA